MCTPIHPLIHEGRTENPNRKSKMTIYISVRSCYIIAMVDEKMERF